MVVAAAFMVCCVGLPSLPAAAGDDEESRVILFSGRDLWRNGAFLYGGLLLAPGGFDQDGFLLKLFYSGGLYRYRAGDLNGDTVVGMELVGHVAPGFQIKRDRFEAKFFLGPDVQDHRLWPDDPGNTLRGRAFGLRVSGELWSEPTERTMIAADAALSTIGTNYSARVAAGWRLFEAFYIGPESQIYGGDGYRQLRFGAHITSMKTGEIEWSAGAGWSRDTDEQSGPYVRLNMMQRIH